MRVRIEKSVVVVTPTIGSEKLLDAMQSVENQDYTNVKHLLVIDGEEHFQKVAEVAKKVKSNGSELNVIKTPYMTLPFNVGGNGFYGHRVYAAIGHLVNADYIAFLDEDNWFDENHIRALVDTIEEDPKLEFVYSLRKIWEPDKSYVTYDKCESLGMWPVWVAPDDHNAVLVDTSSYLFKRSFLEKYGHMWNSGWGADRRFFQLMRKQVPYYSSFKHTLNYRLDGNPNSVDMDFFLRGNDFMRQRHGNGEVETWNI